jgi:hypothetical protein
MLAGLERLDDWVRGLSIMLRRVLVLGGIAASDMTATQAQSQMNPTISCL